jgi:hypothetical protein
MVVVCNVMQYSPYLGCQKCTKPWSVQKHSVKPFHGFHAGHLKLLVSRPLPAFYSLKFLCTKAHHIVDRVKILIPKPIRCPDDFLYLWTKRLHLLSSPSKTTGDGPTQAM